MFRTLIKISGDLTKNEEVIQWLRKVNSVHLGIVIIVGGRTRINERLKQYDLESTFENGVRIHKSKRSRSHAWDVLTDIRDELRKALGSRNIVIEIPCKIIADTICHFDGDDYLRMLAPAFDDVYCLTVKGRIKKFPERIKIKEFDLNRPEPQRATRVDG